MKIKWLGHSSFLISSEQGIRIITDPFGRGFLNLPALFWRMNYKETDKEADVITISHHHWDHSHWEGVGGKPAVISETGISEVKGITFKGVPSLHGLHWIVRKPNIIFCFEVDDQKICHLGDIGYPLNDYQLSQIGRVDVLFVPVGGFMTVGPADAIKICQQLNPRLIIPMHYRNSQCKFPLFSTVEKFYQNLSKEAFYPCLIFPI